MGDVGARMLADAPQYAEHRPVILAGTSVAMIQRHYGHLVKEGEATKLAQVKML